MKIQTTEFGEVTVDFKHLSNIVTGNGIETRRPYATTCEIAGDSVSASGRATAHVNDNFNRATGRKISLERALNDLGASRQTRTEIWIGYHTRVGRHILQVPA